MKGHYYIHGDTTSRPRTLCRINGRGSDDERRKRDNAKLRPTAPPVKCATCCVLKDAWLASGTANKPMTLRRRNAFLKSLGYRSQKAAP